jgi:probable rRNA maturation factor
MASLEASAQAAEGVDLPVSLEAVERAVLAVLRAEGVDDAEVSVTLLPDAEIAHLNQEYLQHEGPTDVISFQLPDPTGRIIGDVYIGADQARRQAAELGAGAGEEVLRLAVHGTLHVLGHEHPEGEGREESEMYRRQEELLAALLRDADPTS